ncbi:hypothetical protein [Mesorhizobium sp. L-8-10]|uniref:hypothetical protein n=1 Tax=Mesorhizobium sp. L-8-10 TaxID=2744523 RepID=UPI001AEF7B55|nr:hypothetical protein [Mesorhizobium sp. L-8-10]
MDIFKALSGKRFTLSDEKRLQEEVQEVLDQEGIEYAREHRLNQSDIIDFRCGPVGIEIKIKGGKRDIYNQIERYAKHDCLEELILVTNVATGFPPELNGKPVYVLNLARAWL